MISLPIERNVVAIKLARWNEFLFQGHLIRMRIGIFKNLPNLSKMNLFHSPSLLSFIELDYRDVSHN